MMTSIRWQGLLLGGRLSILRFSDLLGCALQFAFVLLLLPGRLIMYRSHLHDSMLLVWVKSATHRAVCLTGRLRLRRHAILLFAGDFKLLVNFAKLSLLLWFYQAVKLGLLCHIHERNVLLEVVREELIEWLRELARLIPPNIARAYHAHWRGRVLLDEAELATLTVFLLFACGRHHGDTPLGQSCW